MSEEFHRQGGLAYALAQIERGQLDGAIETLRQLLSEEPDNALAHAVLALCLVDGKRPHAAEHEAAIALTLAPNAPSSHLAMGQVSLANRKFSRAEEHLDQARALDPDNTAVLRAQARLYELTGRRDRVLPVLEQALALEPEDTETIVALGEHHLELRDVNQAEERARTALQLRPGDLDAVVLMGHVHLRRGQIEEARAQALWALSMRATDPGALRLLTAVKARQSPLLGLWWRWNTWMSALGDGKQMLVLLGVYVVIRVVRMVLEQNGQRGAASFVGYAWLGFCIYSWTAPAMFTRMLKRELEQVRLRAGF